MGLRVSTLVIVPAGSAYVAWVRTPELGVGRAVSEALLVAVSGWLATGALTIVARANATVTDAVASAARAAEASLRAERRAYERQRWNGLIHDKVLGALRIAARDSGGGVPDTAAELAAEALATLAGAEPATSGSSLLAGWREHARRRGLSLDAVVTGEVADPEVRAALREAADEALTNIERHSGQRQAIIRAVLGASEATVLIADRGAGFDPSASHPGHGLTSSIRGRMRAVGGRADVESAPGRGTRVTLHWSASSPKAPSEWQLRLFAPLMAVGALAVVLNTTLGATQWLRMRPDAMPAIGILLIGAVTAAATFAEPTDRNWLPVSAAGAVTVGVLTAATATGAERDWRYWFLGALTPAAGAIAFRFRPWAGLTFATGITAAACLGDYVRGRPLWECLPGPVPVLFATAIAGHLVRRSFDDAYGRAAAAAADDTEARLATAIAEERAREDDRRVAVLRDTLGPALEHIAAAKPVTGEVRDQFALLESAGRDQLAAPDLVDTTLAHRLSLARTRGVRIDIVDAPRGTSGTGADLLPSCREVLAALSARVPARTRIRVNWRADAGGAAATMTAFGADLETSCPELADVLAAVAGPGVRVTGDPDSVLVEFPAQ